MDTKLFLNFAKYEIYTKLKYISRKNIKISRDTKVIFVAKFRIAKFRIHPILNIILKKSLLKRR
jgi:hypothetical protein